MSRIQWWLADDICDHAASTALTAALSAYLKLPVITVFWCAETQVTVATAIERQD
jgi:cobyrinic acid a,c-diamide synthase